MVHYFTFDAHSIVPSPEPAPIHHYSSLTNQEMDTLIDRFHMDPHTIASALDPEEVARVEYSAESSLTSLIWKIPTNIKLRETSSFNVLSMGLFILPNVLIILSSEEIDYFGPICHSPNYSFEFNDLFDIALVVIEKTIHHFVEHLRIIKTLSKEIQYKLNTSMGNEYLLQMFNLSEVLIYYLDAINSNKTVLNKFAGIMKNKKLGDEDFLNDLIIEIEQAARQTEIYSEVFSGLMDARGAIVNNNMNMLIKKLTVLNSIFLPLNLIAGIGGMSEYSMMTGSVPWPVAYGFLALGLGALGIGLYYMLHKMERPTTGKSNRG